MTVYAFTEFHNDYPAFVNLSEQDGVLKLSVRTRGNGGKDYASIDLTDTQAEELAEAIFKHVYAADAPAVAATLPAAPAATEQAGDLPPLPKVGPICYAMVADVLEYKVPRVGQRLPGVFDAALWSTDQMQAYACAALAARQAPTDAPKLNQQQEETITLLRMWSEAGHRDLKLLNGDRFGVRALLAGFDVARQAPDSRDAALEEAAALFPQPYMEYFGENIQASIRALKGPAQ